MLKHYTPLWYDEKKRKPLLKVKIMELLALKGEFSKYKTESYFKELAESHSEKKRPRYSEISKAYDVLSDKAFVERRHSSSSVKEKPYGLTLAGLEALLYEKKTVEECWRCTIGYCMNMRKPLAIGTLSVIYDTLMKRFVPYQSIRDHSYILKSFELMSKKFIEEVSKEDKSVVEVLQTLAGTGEMNLEKIASRTGKSKSTIRITMQKLTMECSKYSHIYEYWMNEGDPEIQRLQFADFLQHCLVFSSKKEGQSYYELSLFGILLLLKISRNKSTISSFMTNRDSDWEESFERIASVFCKEKLPLIFGKWPVLTKYLGLWRFYNFDVIISDDDKRKSSPFSTGGNRELSESTYSMYVANYWVCKNIINVGVEMLLDEFDKNYSGSETEFKGGETEQNSIKGLYTLADYLSFRENYLDIETKVGGIFNELKKPNNKTHETRYSWGTDRLFPVKLLEKSLEDEITVDYYINLMKPFYLPDPFGKLIPAIVEDNIRIEKENPGKELAPYSPIDYFRLLLEKDYDIRQFIMVFRKDSSSYFEDLRNKVTTLFESVLDI